MNIALVNMRKRNAITHVMLNSDKNTHLLLIQEPWFEKIGTARQDNARQGVDVLGGVASLAWELLYPSFIEKQWPKVMAYACKPSASSPNAPVFSTVPRLDICAYPTLQVLDVIFDNEQWQVINFYHDVRDNTSLQVLLELDIDAIIPTLVVTTWTIFFFHRLSSPFSLLTIADCAPCLPYLLHAFPPPLPYYLRVHQ